MMLTRTQAAAQYAMELRPQHHGYEDMDVYLVPSYCQTAKAWTVEAEIAALPADLCDAADA